jgi:hypothetical protein
MYLILFILIQTIIKYPNTNCKEIVVWCTNLGLIFQLKRFFLQIKYFCFLVIFFYYLLLIEFPAYHYSIIIGLFLYYKF